MLVGGVYAAWSHASSLDVLACLLVIVVCVRFWLCWPAAGTAGLGAVAVVVCGAGIH